MEIMEKDIRRRVKICNVSVFEKIQAYLINNYRATTSLTSLQKELHKLGMDLKRETLISYGPALENIAYNYARTKGDEISVGKIGKWECDFILRGGDRNYSYVQVSMTMMADRTTEEREYKPLESVRDNYPKYILTRNELIQKKNGIIHKDGAVIDRSWGRVSTYSKAYFYEVDTIGDFDKTFDNKRNCLYNLVIFNLAAVDAMLSQQGAELLVFRFVGLIFGFIGLVFRLQFFHDLVGKFD